ncbi:MAG TPA: hypothetical protein VGE07_23630 [Herpetosiphonaceae bacterium]
MSTSYHTPITIGAAANASTFNTPMGQLDAAIGNLAGGAAVTDATLKEWTAGECFELTALTYNGTYPQLLQSATVKWPDGASGTLSVTQGNITWLAIDAFTITHSLSGKTVTQTAVTRNATGGVTVKPALTVA